MDTSTLSLTLTATSTLTSSSAVPELPPDDPVPAHHASPVVAFIIGLAIVTLASILNAAGLNLTKLDHVSMRTSVQKRERAADQALGADECYPQICSSERLLTTIMASWNDSVYVSTLFLTARCKRRNACVSGQAVFLEKHCPFNWLHSEVWMLMGTQIISINWEHACSRVHARRYVHMVVGKWMRLTCVPEYVAPLGSTSLIFNFLFAKFLVNTPVTKNDIYVRLLACI